MLEGVAPGRALVAEPDGVGDQGVVGLPVEVGHLALDAWGRSVGGHAGPVGGVVPPVGRVSVGASRLKADNL